MPPSWKERLVCALGLREKRCVACREPFEPAGFPHGAVLTIEEATAFFLCPQCAERIRRRTSGFCPYCGEPSVMEEAPCTSCSECMVQLPPWSDFLFFGVYEGLLRDLVLRAKFGGSLAALDFLGALLAGVCALHYEAAPLPSVVIPMPLYVGRLRERFQSVPGNSPSRGEGPRRARAGRYSGEARIAFAPGNAGQGGAQKAPSAFRGGRTAGRPACAAYRRRMHHEGHAAESCGLSAQGRSVKSGCSRGCPLLPAWYGPGASLAISFSACYG